MIHTDEHDRYFLGGADLEMAAIRQLLEESGLGAHIFDHGLIWGARASSYQDEIRAAIAAGMTPVLIELADDLPEDVDRTRLVFIDHHDEKAGAGAPSSLRQVFDRIGAVHGVRWTRWRALVEANDVGHIAQMRAVGASKEEIRQVRDADRKSQGVTDAIEAESRRAIADACRCGDLLIVRTTASSSSAIGDFVTPEYGGPSAENLLVLMPNKVAFFGAGAVVRALADVPASWYGGALPERGYWGANIEKANYEGLLAMIHKALDGLPQDTIGAASPASRHMR